MAKDYNVADEFKIADLETLKIISHPQRIEILTTLRDPKTVKEIAKEIEADPTKLYYHIRLMEKGKLIQVVETNLVSGIVEKKYLVSASTYAVDKAIFSDPDNVPTTEDISNVMQAMLRTTQNHLDRSIKAGFIDLKENLNTEKATHRVESMGYLLTKEQVDLFLERYKTLQEDLKQWSTENDEQDEEIDSREYLWTSAFFPTVPRDD